MGSPPASAIQNSEQAVQRRDTRRPQALPSRLDWADLKLFLAVAGARSLRSAATAERLSVNTLRARIARLEAEFGATVFRRTRAGIDLTDAGAELLRVADEMRTILGGTLETEGNVLIRPGEIRIGCGEGLGTLWLTPRLTELRETIPNLTVNLMCDYDQERDRSGEVDVGISFRMPRDPDLVVSSLGWLHIILFASEAYLREHGQPKSLDEFRDHRFIEQVAPGVSHSALDLFIGSERPAGFIPMRTNSSLSMFWAAASGAGIAALPTYSRAISSKVVPLDLPVQLRFRMWYHYHGSARSSPAVAAAVAWLKAAFDPVAYPWFGETFVHPRDFLKPEPGRRVVSLFESFADSVRR